MATSVEAVFDAMLFPTYTGVSQSSFAMDDRLRTLADVATKEEVVESHFRQFAEDKAIREFYTAASFNLENYFEACRDAEADCLSKLTKKKMQREDLLNKISTDEVEVLLKENEGNKNAQALFKCVEVIQIQTDKLLDQQEDLVTKINLLVKNTADDIRKIKLENIPSDLFNDNITSSIIEERDSCKKRFLTYLQKARTILRLKQEMLDLYKRVEQELFTIEHMLDQYCLVIRNFKISMETLIKPEMIRRREFDQLNAQFTQFYYQWVNRETEAREMFLHKGDLDQLPYAFKKLLVNFLKDDEIQLIPPQGTNSVNIITIEEIKSKLVTFFEKWTKPSEELLKNKVADIYIQKITLEKQLDEQHKIIHLFQDKYNDVQAWLDAERLENKELAARCHNLSKENAIQLKAIEELNTKTDSLRQEVDKLTCMVNEHHEEKQEIKAQFAQTTLDLAKLEAETKAKEVHILELKQAILSLEEKKATLQRLIESTQKELRVAAESYYQELTSAKQFGEDVAQEKAFLEKELDAMKKFACSLEKRVISADDAIMEMKDQQEKELAQQKTLISSLQSEVRVKEDQIEGVTKQNVDYKEQIKKMQDKYDQSVKRSTEEIITQTNEEKKCLEDHLEALNKEIRYLRDHATEVENKYSLSLANQSEQENTINVLTNQLAKAHDKIVNQFETVEKIQKERNDLQQKLANQDKVSQESRSTTDPVEGEKPPVPNFKCSVVQEALRRIETTFREEYETTITALISKIEKIENKGCKVEESVKNLVRNNQMGILLKYLHN